MSETFEVQVPLSIPGDMFMTECTLRYEGDRIYFKNLGYNPNFNKEIKYFEGYKWDKPEGCKMWSVKRESDRNAFRLQYMLKQPVYDPYDKIAQGFEPEVPDLERPLFKHQITMLAVWLYLKCVVWACEMGTGKSLVFIEAAERAVKEALEAGTNNPEVWYIGPKSGKVSVERELEKWDCTANVKLMTYNKLTQEHQRYKDLIKHDQEPEYPVLICFDESTKIKTPTAKRSKAAAFFAQKIRDREGGVIVMSGTPSPLKPTDWWHQCEVAQPGFLRESYKGLEERLGLWTKHQSPTGGKSFLKLATWYENPKLCFHCGKTKSQCEGLMHKFVMNGRGYCKTCDKRKSKCDGTEPHKFANSINEVEKLKDRLKGLVLVKLKSECTDLPEKHYRRIRVKPSPDMLNACKLIMTKSTRAATAYTKMRALSDGFQYVEEAEGSEVCPNCGGCGEDEIPIPSQPHDINNPSTEMPEFEFIKSECDNCGGTGKVIKYVRGSKQLGSPKDEVLKDLLEEHEAPGRVVIWGGFTGTIDRLVELCHNQGWATLRVDGRGYHGADKDGNVLDSKVLLNAMDRSHKDYEELRREYPLVAFVGHPQAGGMGLTLTASPSCIFYSNCYNGEARMQAEDRIHRFSMSRELGATIIDILCLPIDLVVLKNQVEKKRLQDLTMGEIHNAFITSNVEERYDYGDKSE